ncbi:hypothetical protein [Burkholderia cepacia]|uniref:hypothetical protein n=1 Tax=Burkholderia cepacia TaxID=292 RepID=UPI00158C8959|nr:hypothetical protein [Burkholderia cepacia]
MSLLNKLRSLRYRLTVLPTHPEEIGDYKVRFEQAIRFTNRCGFSEPNVRWIECDLLGTDDSFARKAIEAAGINDLSMSAGQCLKWCHYLRPRFEEALGVPVRLTIGQIWNGTRSIFNPTWDDMRRWSQGGIDPVELAREGREGVNLHAWLTVETGEIIEPTFPSSLARAFGGETRKLMGGLAWGRDPGFFGNHRYLPMMIGDEVAEAIGGHPHLPLLARSKEDLMAYPQIGALYPID